MFKFYYYVYNIIIIINLFFLTWPYFHEIHLSTLVMFEFEWGTILRMDAIGSQNHLFPYLQKLPACV